MKKRILSFLALCVLASVLLFAVSCNKNESSSYNEESVSQSVQQSNSETESEHVHNYSNVKSTDEGHWLECDCGAKGEIEAHVGEATCESKATCSVCKLTYGTIGLHNFVDETCTFCNRKASQGLEYRLSEDETYYILVGVGSCTDTEILIPSLHKGLPVKEIGPRAFSMLGNITKIEIGDSVTTIRNGAFGRQNSLGEQVLNELVISKSVSLIESGQTEKGREFLKVEYKGDIKDWCNIHFEDISSNFFRPIENQEFYINGELLKEVVIPETVTEIKPFAFIQSKITKLKLSSNTTKIGEYAFSMCSNLIEVDLGGVQAIGQHAFYGCLGLVKVIVGADLKEVANEAFMSSFKIVEVINNSPNITLEAGSDEFGYIAQGALSVANCNSDYVSKISYDNGFILYEGKILVGYNGESENLVVPDCVVSIQCWAFVSNYYVESIVIPSSVVELGEYAFEFASITEVYYGGSLEDWLNISLNGYFSNPLSNGANLYIGNELVSELVIPESVESIPDFAFAGCKSLTSVTIPSSVQTVEEQAFCNCENLLNISICGENTIIEDDVFRGTAFYKDTSNWSFGCLYLGNILLDGTDASVTTCKIKNETIQIAERAFKIIIHVKNMVIPNSVKIIVNGAFPKKGSLKNVYYEGTAEEWQALIVNIDSDNILFKVTVYFYVENEADVPDDGENYWHYDSDGKPVAWYA